jgi:hypothetical protein
VKKAAIIIAVALAIGAIAAIFWPEPVNITERGGARRHCVSNLKLINAAKAQWALENNKASDAVPTTADIARYLKSVPSCPSGGVHTVGSLNELPKCSVKDHNI